MTDEAANLAFARSRMIDAMAPPVAATGAIAWLRKNLFNSWINALLTLVALYLVWLIVPPLIRFLLIDAVWDGASRDDCLAEKVGRQVGACWPFIQAKFKQLVYGFYPADQYWRPNLTFILGAALLIPLLIPRVPYKTLNAILFFGVFPVLAFFLLVGGKIEGLGLAAFLRLVDTILSLLVGLADLPVIGPLFTDLAYVLALLASPILRIVHSPYGLWNDLVVTMLLTALVVALVKRPPGRVRAVLWTIAAFVAFGAVIKLIGFDRGLGHVETRLWGGLLVTLVVAVTGIVASLPLGIMLALGRRSQLPVVRFFSVIFIEFWRGVPLITVLFFATY